MRLSRGCYDKYHRCPGWAGGGMRSAKVDRCEGGRIQIDFDDRWWRWKFHHCGTCDVVVWPYHARWLDPRWYPATFRSWRYRVQFWWEGR